MSTLETPQIPSDADSTPTKPEKISYLLNGEAILWKTNKDTSQTAPFARAKAERIDQQDGVLVQYPNGKVEFETDTVWVDAIQPADAIDPFTGAANIGDLEPAIRVKCVNVSEDKDHPELKLVAYQVPPEHVEQALAEDRSQRWTLPRQ